MVYIAKTTLITIVVILFIFSVAQTQDDEMAMFDFIPYSATILEIAWNSDGTKLAVNTWFGIDVYDAETLELITTIDSRSSPLTVLLE